MDLSSVWCVLARWWTGPHCLCAAVGTSCLVSFDRATLWTCGSLKGTQRDCFGCVCVVCTSPRGVGVDRRRACPHRRDVELRCTTRCQWYCAPPLAQWLCEFAIGDRSGRTTMVTPADRGGLGKARLRSDRTPVVFVSLRLWAFATGRICTAWRHTLVMHD